MSVDTYTIVVRRSNTSELALVDAVHEELLEDGVGRSGPHEKDDREQLGCELHF